MKPKTSQPFDVILTGTHSLKIPDAVAKPFAIVKKPRVKVTATHEAKTLEFHAALQKRKGDFYITFGKRHQKELGISANEPFSIQLQEDTTEYGVHMPKELEAVLESDPQAYEAFKELTDGKKRSLIYHIKRIKTSQIRIDKALLISENLKAGITITRELTKRHFG
ncbi:YdeI/OmpD-associated family protein [Luteirhabdus pelagi]|uniref:YdeI/OmpD-associated family protein n=1 Tax=Luteirhabdus pelagi TaxID=2792783 RepID=UPI00193AB754|nr:YdeI/OmpD-associated family protein [Luteirhabdus pelagi]